ncbi:MAG: DUF4097 domain-containing protein [Saprospiraceae bacterium]|nr:DUF4097 domain-containing protein [Saprospiraceae bacterium]
MIQKTKSNLVLTVALVTVSTGLVFGQQSISKEISGDGLHVLLVANIFGNVTIQGSNTSKILVSGEQSLKATTSEAELAVKYEKMGDTLAIYIQSPCNLFTLRRDKDKNDWGYYKWVEDCRFKDELHVDFKITVPQNTEVVASTINSGDIKVHGVKENVIARNINGGIEIEGPIISLARTINGDVKLDFLTNPVQAGEYYTLNGDIQATFSQRLDAELTFESFNGDFYTNSKDMTILPTPVQKSEDRDGFFLKIGGTSEMRIGNGGALLDFETFNGDVIVKINSL